MINFSGEAPSKKRKVDSEAPGKDAIRESPRTSSRQSSCSAEGSDVEVAGPSSSSGLRVAGVTTSTSPDAHSVSSKASSSTSSPASGNSVHVQQQQQEAASQKIYIAQDLIHILLGTIDSILRGLSAAISYKPEKECSSADESSLSPTKLVTTSLPATSASSEGSDATDKKAEDTEEAKCEGGTSPKVNLESERTK